MVKSVCGYCGVGCGLEYDEKKLIGDVAYPANQGNVCSKGVSELVSMQTPTRLLRPHIRECIKNDYNVCSWEKAIETISEKIKTSAKDKIGFYLSGQLLTEDYYIANKLVKGFIGTNNVDTNSRTCMASAVAGYKKAIGADFVPVRMNDIFKSDLLILAGANTAEAHVVFHNQIKKAKKSGLKVVVLDPRKTDTAKIADLYLSKYEDFSEKAVLRKTKNTVNCAMFLTKLGMADCVAAGREYTTADVIIAAQSILGTKEGVGSVSSLGILNIPGYEGPEGQMLAIADCAVNMDPDSETLADIAISSADTIKALLG